MNKIGLIILGIFVIVGGFLALDGMYTVHVTRSALVLQFGRPVAIKTEPGLHFKMPMLQSVEYYEKRILELDPQPQEVILKDQKRVNVDSFMRYRIINPLEFKKKAVTQANFLQLFGGRLNAEVRAAVGQALLADMLSEKRDDIMAVITKEIRAEAKEFGVEVVDVRIGRTDLPRATAESVYNRMRSQRVAQAAQLRAEGAEIKARIQSNADRERTIILAEAERQARILRGEGEGQQTRILNEAFGRDPEFFAFYRSMEAYGKALGDGTTMVLSPDSEFFRFFNQISKDPKKK
jgi:membrane protease subunit HflC